MTRTGMPWCPGTPVSPGNPGWPCWIRNDPNNISILLYEIDFAISCTNTRSYTIELNNHSLVQETGSRLTPYHRPCFARQPRSTSIPSIPLEMKSKPKRTLKKFLKRIISILVHILVDVKRIFLWDSVSVYILFICLFWQYLSAKTAQF